MSKVFLTFNYQYSAGVNLDKKIVSLLDTWPFVKKNILTVFFSCKTIKIGLNIVGVKVSFALSQKNRTKQKVSLSFNIGHCSDILH